MGFKATVSAGVLSTLLAAIATWLFGFWPILWTAVIDLSRKLWQATIFPVPVPLGLLVPIVVFAAVFALRLWRKEDAAPTPYEPRYSSRAVPTGEWKKREAVEPAPLSNNEIKMLRALAHADGQELMLSDLASRSGFSNLLAEQTAEHLHNRRYISHRRDILYGSMLRLSPTGRDHILSAGY